MWPFTKKATEHHKDELINSYLRDFNSTEFSYAKEIPKYDSKFWLIRTSVKKLRFHGIQGIDTVTSEVFVFSIVKPACFENEGVTKILTVKQSSGVNIQMESLQFESKVKIESIEEVKC